MKPIREDHPLKKLFKGLVEHSLLVELGVCDIRVVDYLSDLLVEFVHMDRLRALEELAGRPMSEIGSMLSRVMDGDGGGSLPRDWSVHRHIGDYALFWAGVYPERLRSSTRATYRDRLGDFVSQGKRSYAIASELKKGEAEPEPALLRRLSGEFEACVHGLHLVRREWEDARVWREGDSIQLLY